jgi:hypothetical protein
MSNLFEEAASENTPPERLIELAKTSVELGKIVATNINAPPELLEELASQYNDDVEILKAITSNPNTSIDTLFALGIDYPEEFLENPALSLFLLENPNLPNSIPVNIKTPLFKKILPLANLPQTIINSIVNNLKDYKDYGEFAITITNNPQTSQGILDKLAHFDCTFYPSDNNNIIEAVYFHVNYSGEMTDDWQEAAFQHVLNEQYYISDILLSQLLSKLGLIPDTLKINSNGSDGNCSYINNPLSQEIYGDRLAQFQYSSKSSMQPYYDICFALKLAFGIVTALIIIFIPLPQYVKYGVILVAILIGLLELLTTEKVIKITNPLRLKILNIYRKIILRFFNLDKAIADISHQIKIHKNINLLPIYIPTNIRHQTAIHPRTPNHILEILSQDTNSKVRLAVAENINTPLPILNNLMGYNSKVNANITYKALENIFKHHSQEFPAIFANFIDNLNLDTPTLLLLLNPLATEEFIIKYHTSPNWRHRYAIANNPKTPQHIREKLTQDANSLVRAIAKAKLKSIDTFKK